ncbi:MAG TPA: hypothetical protein PK014_04345 [Thermoanaerobaculia bacterium]|nr:hypothetical protein [Thermoanaerobaculia bacterium]HUM29286.1 hypothetical protein [Thermoanaerobaculia bacterium]HXK67756.1 hypothetical protein [Thermoanaerobaculia bacterium]
MLTHKGWGIILPPFFLLLVCSFLSCGKETPEERVTSIRKGYDIKLNGWNYTEQGVILDIVVTRSVKETLPGITAELYHFDANNQQIAMIPVYIKTEAIPYGVSAQMSIPLPDLNLKDDEGLGLKYFHYPTQSQINQYKEYREPNL